VQYSAFVVEFYEAKWSAASPRKLVVSETSEDIFNYDNRDWIKTLEKLPGFTHEQLENKLVKNSRTMPDKIAPKAYRLIEIRRKAMDYGKKVM
jgi:hypothetical protein